MAFKDGTRIPIIEKCICGTNNPFWKPVEDVENKVEARSMLKKRKKVRGYIWIITIKRNNYLCNYNFDTFNIQCIYFFNKIEKIYCVFVLLFFPLF